MSDKQIKMERRVLEDGTAGYDFYDQNGRFIRFLTENEIKWTMRFQGVGSSLLKGLGISLVILTALLAVAGRR